MKSVESNLSLQGKTIVITGGSRGIGRQIALRCAQDGANIVIAAKTDQPHPKLPGTIHDVAREVEEAGGQALAMVTDVRSEEQVGKTMAAAADRFGGIDALVNNAGAIRLTGVEKTPIKRFDLMHQVNTRAVIVCTQAALPWLRKSDNAHIINLSPPLNMDPKWFAGYAPYTITKYGMSMLTIGMAEEFRRAGIAVNSLWPHTIIATAAVEFEVGIPDVMRRSRKPEIMAEAAWHLLTSTQGKWTGQHLIDEQILRARGITDLAPYRHDSQGDAPLMKDLFL